MQNIIVNLFNDNAFLGTFFASLLPVIEARGAFTLGISSQIWDTPLNTFYSFATCILASTIMVTLLLLVTYPVCKYLKSLNFMQMFINKLEQKVYSVRDKNEKSLKFESLKSYLFLMLFTAVPLPLTGYYSACLIASFIGLNKLKSFLFITLGNIICLMIMLLVSTIFSNYVNIIFYIFVVIFIITVIYFIFDSVYKSKKNKFK